MPIDNSGIYNLSKSETKSAVFSEDLFFREGFQEWTHSGAIKDLKSTALLMFKPDSIVGRRIEAALSYVVSRGFKPVFWKDLKLNRYSMRELWKYDWHTYTSHRLKFSTEYYSSCRVFLVLLQTESNASSIPASVRLSALKGSADPKKRERDSMRAFLTPPNSVFNFVHVADEPIDIIRELALLSNEENLINALRYSGRSTLPSHQNLDLSIASLYNSVAENKLCLQSSLTRLSDNKGLATTAVKEIINHIDCNQFMSWSRFKELTGESDQLDWDKLVVAASVLDLDRPSDFTVFQNATLADWAPKKLCSAIPS